VVEAPSGRRRPDVVVRAGGVTCLVELKTQPHTNAAAARQLAEHARQLAEDTWLLLVAGPQRRKLGKSLRTQAWPSSTAWGT